MQARRVGDMTQSKLGHRPRVLLHPGTRKRGYSGREDPRHILDWRNNKKQHIWQAEDSGPVPQGHACCWDLTRWASSAPILQRKAHSTAQGRVGFLAAPRLKVAQLALGEKGSKVRYIARCPAMLIRQQKEGTAACSLACRSRLDLMQSCLGFLH
jgi:hypothetical protein